MDQKTILCNSEVCKTSCPNFTICSVLKAEKHISTLEEKISSIFSSLNEIIEFSSENGKNLLEIREIIPEKEDIVNQFNLVYSEIENLKKIILNGNSELKNLIFEYSNELRNIVIRIENIEKAILPEKGTDTNV